MIYDTIAIKINSADYDNCGQFPTLTAYIQNYCEHIPFSESRPAVLICPGGGYAFVSEREAEPIATKFLAEGFNCFVLNYSVNPARFPCALYEVAYSMAYIRQHAKEYHIDDSKIAVVGFSAGGHLAASLGVFWNDKAITDALNMSSEMFKPTATILSYPVISSNECAHDDSFKNLLGEEYNDKQLLEKMSLEKQVTKDTVPSFIWHTFEDGLVPVENSLLYAKALGEQNIPYELHIFQKGGHGLSTASKLTGAEQDECQCWIDMATRWLTNL